MDIRISFPGGKRVDADLGGFVVHTDQRPSAGGEGSSPEPFALFLASLAACAGTYVLGFCQARGIPTEGLALRQRSEVDPESHRLTRVRIDIELPSGFPGKYVDAVRKAVDQCAVKRVIASPPEFVITARPRERLAEAS